MIQFAFFEILVYAQLFDSQLIANCMKSCYAAWITFCDANDISLNYYGFDGWLVPGLRVFANKYLIHFKGQ